MKDGLYALASLDGAPLDPADLHTLGLDIQADGDEFRQVPGLALRLVDRSLHGAASSIASSPRRLAALAGFLDEPEQLAASLGLDATQAHAEFAAAACARFGADAPLHAVGEWSFLEWDAAARRLTLVASQSLRDPIFIATDGRRVAIAPDALRLTRLAWVGREINSISLALQMSRAGLRHLLADETVWKHVTRLAPGATQHFQIGSRTRREPNAQPEPESWQGSFEEAVELLDATGRRIVGQQLSRYGRTAFLLSGGLDSTLLTTWGALERGAGREMFAVSSVAPPGSGLEDEREFSAAVAERLGLAIQYVSPPAEWSPYRPSDRLLRALGSPTVGPRHYLYDALHQSASDGGARALIDGLFGEMSLTDKTPLPVRVHPLRALARTARALVRRGFRPKPQPEPWPVNAFHVRFAPELLDQIPAAWEGRFKAPVARVAGSGGVFGIQPQVRKNAWSDTSTDYGLRHLLPFRDQRLLRAVAPLPFHFGHHGGVTRALARALLAGRVPERIRLRPRGRPFSPDFDLRMRTKAEAARARIPLFREAGIGHSIDLVWLERWLGNAAAGKDMGFTEQFQTQATAVTAEFLLWAKTDG